jgi:hypothetical protein
VKFMSARQVQFVAYTLPRQRHSSTEGGGVSWLGRKKLLRSAEVISLPKSFWNRRTISSWDIVATCS